MVKVYVKITCINLIVNAHIIIIYQLIQLYCYEKSFAEIQYGCVFSFFIIVLLNEMYYS